MAFNDYESALYDRVELNQKIEKAPEPQKSQLRQEGAALDQTVVKRGKDLDAALDNIKKYYPHNALIEKRIHDFQDYKNQSEKQILTSTNSEWDFSFLNLQIGVTKAIDKAETGYEDPMEAENQKIMASVPAAEEALKKHPNDKKLCTVMQQVLVKNPQITAQQIAFFNVGNQYCPRYYADPAAWGEWGIKARPATPTPSKRPASPVEKTNEEKGNQGNAKQVALNQKYGSLPYPQYYNQYVLPLIPKAIETLKNPQQNKDKCLIGYLNAGPRNPEKDAERAAYTQVGKQYCPPNTIERGFNGTGVMCLAYCDVLCPEGMACDCVERCKKTPGVLFKSNP